MNALWLSTLEKLASEESVVYSSIPKSIRKELEQWADRTGAIAFNRQGRGVTVRLKNRVILETEIRRISPQIETDSESSRAVNLARFGDTKTGETRHEFSYYLAKAIGDGVTVSKSDLVVNLSELSIFTGCFAIPIAQNSDPWNSDLPLILIENQGLFDNLNWLDSSWNGILLYYAGNLSERLITWLAKSHLGKIMIFPDYDGVGLSNFARLKNAVPLAEWFWAKGWESAVQTFGNRMLWQNEMQRNLVENLFADWETTGFPDQKFKSLIELMRIEGKMLEQEWVLV